MRSEKITHIQGTPVSHFVQRQYDHKNARSIATLERGMDEETISLQTVATLMMLAIIISGLSLIICVYEVAQRTETISGTTVLVVCIPVYALIVGCVFRRCSL